MKKNRYRVEFINRETHDRRSYVVYEYNLLAADVAGMKCLEVQEGADWRRAWWAVGAVRERF